MLISLQEELRLLEYSQRLQLQSRAIIANRGDSNGRKLFDEVLQGGNRAAQRRSGKIAPGFWADLVALDTDNYQLDRLRTDTVLDAWIFAASERLISDVWSAGRQSVKCGRHVNRDNMLKSYRDKLKRLRDQL